MGRLKALQYDKALLNALAGMVSLATAMGIGRFVYTPLLPALMTGTGLTVSQAGWIASANFVGYLLGAILGGGGWAQGKERTIALTSLLASSLLAAAMGLSHDFLVFLIIRFAAGLASAFCLVFTTTIVFARLAQANRMDLQSVVFSGVGLGIALSSVLTGIVYFEEARWQSGWFASGVLSLIGTLIVFFLLAPTAKMIGAGSRELPLPRSRPFWAMTLAYGFFGAGYVVTATFLIAIVRAGAGGPQMEAGVWLVTGIAAFLSLHVWKAAVASIGLVMAFAVACVIESFGVMASVLISGVVGPIIGGALLGGTFVVITAYGLAAGRMSAPDAPRKALAVMTAAFGIGQVLAPIAAGYLADWTGGFLVPSIGAALLLLLSAATAVCFGSESSAHRT